MHLRARDVLFEQDPVLGQRTVEIADALVVQRQTEMIGLRTPPGPVARGVARGASVAGIGEGADGWRVARPGPSVRRVWRRGLVRRRRRRGTGKRTSRPVERVPALSAASAAAKWPLRRRPPAVRRALHRPLACSGGRRLREPGRSSRCNGRLAPARPKAGVAGAQGLPVLTGWPPAAAARTAS